MAAIRRLMLCLFALWPISFDDSPVGQRFVVVCLQLCILALQQRPKISYAWHVMHSRWYMS